MSSWPPQDHSGAAPVRVPGPASEGPTMPAGSAAPSTFSPQPPTVVHGYPYGNLPSAPAAAPPLYPAFSGAAEQATTTTTAHTTATTAPVMPPPMFAGSPFHATPVRAAEPQPAPTSTPAMNPYGPPSTNPYAAVPPVTATAAPPQPPALPPTTRPAKAPPVAAPEPDVYVPAHVQLPTTLARDEFVEEVVQETAKQWADAQYRRHHQQQQPFGAAAADDATYLQRDALTGASHEAFAEMERLLSGGEDGASPAGTIDPQALERYLAAMRRREESAQPDLIFVVSGRPKHQYRLLLLLAVTLFGTLPLMSSMALMVLLAGLVVMYVMDFLDYPRATIFSMLATVVCFGVAVFLSNFHAAVTHLGPTLLILDLVGVLLVVVAAGLLHFHWIQVTYPELICTMERTIMAAAPLLAMPSIFSTSLALTGARYGPVTFFLALCVLHYTFYAPLESSFMRVRVAASETTRQGAPTAAPGGAAAAAGAARPSVSTNVHGSEPGQRRAKLEDDENPETEDETRPQQLNGRAEAIFFTLVLLILPSLVYSALQSNWGDHIVANVFNTWGFLCGGLVYLCVDPARSIWFLALPPRALSSASSSKAVRTNEQVKAAVAAEEALRRLEYDPLGLELLVQRHRLSVLSSACVMLVLWAAYRLVSSRHAYVFNGLPFPANFIALVLIFYLILYVVIETMYLLDLDGQGVNVRTPKYLTRRALVVLAAQIAAVSLCLVSGAPPTFFLPASLSIAAFHLFLLDRTNAGPMIAFTVFSSLMLLWWLYRTFSFLVVDLHVLGEVASVPTPVLTLSVLWMYVLGCITFTLSFSPNKLTLILFLFMYVTQLTWIEHVLYSQKEEGTYPGVLVLATSAVGVFLARRMYKNEVLSVSAAAFVAACFIAKIPTFLIEVTSSYYYDEITLARARKAQQLTASQSSSHDSDVDFIRRRGPVSRPPKAVHVDTSTAPTRPSAAEQAWDRSAKLYAVESATAWWAALVAGYVAVLFVLEARRRLDVSHAARYIFVYCFCAAVLSLCTVRNVQRAVYELITRSYVDAEEVGHIGVGTACAAYALMTMPLLSRLKGKYTSARLALRVSRVVGAAAVLLLLVQPTRVVEKHISFLDYEFDYAEYGRWAAAVGLMLLLGARFLGQTHLPLPVRAVYWLATSLAMAFGIVTMLMPVPTTQLLLFVWLFVFLTMLSVDLAHYRNLHAIELYVVYALSIAAILMAFFSLNRVNLDAVAYGNPSVKWEIHEQGRLQLLAVVMASNLFLSVLLKFRVSGRPLLPGSTPLSADGMRGVSVIANYATMLTTCVTCILNFYANDSEPLLYVVSALFLLMLVDDGELFFDLHKEQFRYFPTAAFALAMLWFCAAYHAWHSAIIVPLKIQNVGVTLLCGLLTLPAQASLLRFLYQGRHRGGDSVALVVVTAALSSLMVVLAPQQSVRWMAIIASGGQMWRLFAHRLGGQASRRAGPRGPKPGVSGPRATSHTTRRV